MDLLSELEWRGLLQDVSDRESVAKLTPDHSFYVGYDPTAPSLTNGNLVPITVSLRLAKAGLKAIQLFGGATGAIGDPSGKSAERKLISRETIEQNIASQSRKVREIFDRAGLAVEFVNNYDWTGTLSTIDFLREVGKHFTVNYMLSKEVVRSRLDGEGVSFTEFSYMLLQANDFVHLYQHNNCRMQIGGSEQWGNITAGLELLRKKGFADACALSFPLITDTQGKKFGKSEGNPVWLNEEQTSPYRFHQFWFNQPDSDVARLLKVYTFLSSAEIEELAHATQRTPEKRAAQTALADSVCTMVHGAKATADAKRCAQALFGGSIEGLSDAAIEDLFRDAPSSSYARSSLTGLPIIELLVRTKLVPSKSEARRLVTAGGAYLDNQRLSNPEELLSDQLLDKQRLVLRSGKRNYHLVRLID